MRKGGSRPICAVLCFDCVWSAPGLNPVKASGCAAQKAQS